MIESKEAFYRRVYAVVSEIPEGMVTTYGTIAKMIDHPRHARMVGTAMKNIPENMEIPAHRVVNSSGKLAPEYVFGSKSLQRIRLEAEGVTFKEDGRINMKKHIWQ